MGRRSVPLSDTRRWVFNRVAGDYLARPPYPDRLVERLAALAGGPGARAVDLGAGTGLLSVPLARRGLRITAVEPALAMLDALARRGTALADRICTVHAAAEATGLPGAAFDLALLADSVQWVDPERAGREVARLLAPGGALALVEARFAPTPFMDGLSRLLADANPKGRAHPSTRGGELLARAAPGRRPIAEEFRQEAALAPATLAAILRSFTYVGPALGPSALDALLAEADRLAARCGGALFARELTLRWVARAR